MLTSVIAAKIKGYLNTHNILTDEQKCYKNSKDCKDQIIIDSIIMNQAIKKQRNLNMAYIDYKKAFDSVPHDYLIDILRVYKIDINVINFLQHAMKFWTTSLHIAIDGNMTQSRELNIRRGIFQGDSLSALWFSLALNPLSNTLNATKYGFNIKADNGGENIQVNHLLYMDDLKLYASSRNQLNQLLDITFKFSKAIQMDFGMDKCGIADLERGSLVRNEGLQLPNEEIMQCFSQDQEYKYLGILQLRGISHTTVKNKLKECFQTRVRQILRTQLNFSNKIRAINTYAIPVLTYSFGLIKWSLTDLEELERIIRVSLTEHRMRHPKAAVERVSLPTELGGMGILHLKNLYTSQIASLRHYFHSKSQISTLFNVICKADTNATPLQLSNQEFQVLEISPQDQISNWKQKELHGTHPHVLEQEVIDKTSSNLWLKKGNIFGETVGFMIAIQDRVIRTKNYRKYILKENLVDVKCRRCAMQTESIEHITGGCSTLASVDYTQRHNNVAKIVHKELANKSKLIIETTPYYKYEPCDVLENDHYKLYWDREIRTDKRIQANRPDILIFNKNSKEVSIIDIAVPLNHNLQHTYAQKINKYLELASEIKGMWKVDRVTIHPIVLSATGVIPRTLVQQLYSLDLQHLLSLLQKSVVLDTCHIVRRFLNAE